LATYSVVAKWSPISATAELLSDRSFSCSLKHILPSSLDDVFSVNSQQICVLQRCLLLFVNREVRYAGFVVVLAVSSVTWNASAGMSVQTEATSV